MVFAEVVVTVTDPIIGARRYHFSSPQVCLVGRAHDCDIEVPSDSKHLEISRHHCLLVINPPQVRIRDLGSANGTFVNGARIGRPLLEHEDTPVAGDIESGNSAVPLLTGDAVRLGNTAVCLGVEILVGEPQLV